MVKLLVHFNQLTSVVEEFIDHIFDSFICKKSLIVCVDSIKFHFFPCFTMIWMVCWRYAALIHFGDTSELICQLKHNFEFVSFLRWQLKYLYIWFDFHAGKQFIIWNFFWFISSLCTTEFIGQLKHKFEIVSFLKT